MNVVWECVCRRVVSERVRSLGLVGSCGCGCRRGCLVGVVSGVSL